VLLRINVALSVVLLICALALRNGFVPGGLNTQQVDPALPLDYLADNRELAAQRVLSNSFGFGGTNCSLILGRADGVGA